MLVVAVHTLRRTPHWLWPLCSELVALCRWWWACGCSEGKGSTGTECGSTAQHSTAGRTVTAAPPRHSRLYVCGCCAPRPPALPYRQTVANKGEPKRSGLDPDPRVMATWLAGLGFRLRDMPTHADLQERLYPPAVGGWVWACECDALTPWPPCTHAAGLLALLCAATTAAQAKQ